MKFVVVRRKTIVIDEYFEVEASSDDNTEILSKVRETPDSTKEISNTSTFCSGIFIGSIEDVKKHGLI